jgi:hypothetical protein
MTRSEMMARMPASEFIEWVAFDRIEPFGDRRADIHSALIRTMMANMFARKEGDPPFPVEDFIPSFEPRPERIQTPEQQLNLMKMLAVISKKSSNG